MSKPKHLIVIGGATATGKTKAAIEVARHFGSEIISADSRQFYREMSIGTAKPDEEELSLAKHHFVDHLSVDEDYSVGDYEREVISFLDNYFEENDLAILTGGSGLFIRAVCEGLNEFPEVPEEIDQALRQLYEQEGIEPLQEEIKKLDPIYSEEVDIQNPVRLIRALGVCRASGKAFSSFRNQEKPDRVFTPIYICLEMEREKLYDRINQRVDLMVEKGLVEEARKLFPKRHLNALQTVGYQELFDHFSGKHSLEDGVELIKRNSRRYAKRQMTWFRKNDFWQRFNSKDIDGLISFIEEKTHFNA